MLEYKTAIKRVKLSAPVSYLKNAGLLKGRLLDYGCGRGFDAFATNADKYDLHFFKDKPKGTFDTIWCVYVLNVIESEKVRQEVVSDVVSMLSATGTAFFAVRTDVKNLVGKTSIGTWQGLVQLNLPLLFRNSSFAIYVHSNKENRYV